MGKVSWWSWNLKWILQPQNYGWSMVSLNGFNNSKQWAEKFLVNSPLGNYSNTIDWFSLSRKLLNYFGPFCFAPSRTSEMARSESKSSNSDKPVLTYSFGDVWWRSSGGLWSLWSWETSGTAGLREWRQWRRLLCEGCGGFYVAFSELLCEKKKFPRWIFGA